MGQLHFPVKPKPTEISQKLWQASGLEANNVCYLNQCNPYGEYLEE